MRSRRPGPGPGPRPGGKLYWEMRERPGHIQEWLRKESQRKRRRCPHSDGELRRAAERESKRQRNTDPVVSVKQFKDLVLVQEQQREAKKRKPMIGPLSPSFVRELEAENALVREECGRMRGYDTFSCDKAAYELLNRAVDKGRPLGRWVNRMLQAGCLFSDINYLERSGWRAWPYSKGHLCAEKARKYLRGLNIDEESLLPSMHAYVQANLRASCSYKTVFVTGCREFYERVLLNKKAMKWLLDAFLDKERVLLRPDYLIARVWYVCKDEKAPNSADEVFVAEKMIRDPDYNGTTVEVWPWLESYGPRQDKSAFLPDELPALDDDFRTPAHATKGDEEIPEQGPSSAKSVTRVITCEPSLS